MSEHTYWNAVRDLVETAQQRNRPKHEVREEIVHLVQNAEQSGEDWAHETLTRWDLAGADRDYTRVFKDMNTITMIRRDGRKVRKTVGYSRPARSTEDGQIIGRQMQAWWGMSRDAVAELLNEMTEQSERLADVRALLAELLAAMDRHPNCATAAEAWVAEGHSLDEIDLDVAA